MLVVYRGSRPGADAAGVRLPTFWVGKWGQLAAGASAASANRLSIQASIDEAIAAGGGHVFFPNAGEWWVDGTIVVPITTISLGGTLAPTWAGWNDGGTVIRCQADTIIMEFGGDQIEDITFDGRGADGNNAAGIGLVLAARHQIKARSIVTRGCTEAGFVLNGTQNSLLQSIDSGYNGVNIWVTGLARNNIFLNASCSDEGFESVNTFIDGNDPNTRNIWVGPRVQPYITMPEPGFFQSPSNLTFHRGIFERMDRHTHNIEINRCWGFLKFEDCDIQGAIVSPIHIAANVTDVGALDVRFDTVTSDNVTVSVDPPETIPMVTSDYVWDQFLPLTVKSSEPITSSRHPNWALDVREDVNTNDGLFKNVLNSPATFAHNIGSWYSSGGVGGADATHEGRRLRITVDNSVFGGDCLFQIRWSNEAFIAGATYDYDADNFIKIRYHLTAFDTTTEVNVQVLLAASPWVRDVGLITAVGEGELLYECQGDEQGGLRICGTGTAGWAEFAYLTAHVY